MESDILVARQSGVTTITFNRPDQRNAIGYEGWTQLQRILADVEEDDEARVVVLTGAGDKAFSAGADIKDFDLYRSDSKGARKYSGKGERCRLSAAPPSVTSTALSKPSSPGPATFTLKPSSSVFGPSLASSSGASGCWEGWRVGGWVSFLTRPGSLWLRNACKLL